jgi:hypothetical protein
MMTTTAIAATKVPEEARLDFLPKLFGRHFMKGEMLVYTFMGKLCSAYKGGYWEFYTLSNGSGFMVPVLPGDPERLDISWADNAYEGSMSPEAAGIVASLYALNYLANMTEEDAMIEAFHALREFAVYHPESREIMGAID